MGDENPIRTLGDYSKPSHEGYRNTIELPIYSGPHDTQYYMEDPKHAFVEYVSSRTDKAGDARMSKFEADFKQQQSEMTNKINIVLKAITDRIAGALPNDTVKNPKLSTSPVFSARSYPTKDPQCSSHPSTSINAIKTCSREANISQTSLLRLRMEIKMQQPKEPEPTLKDEFQDLHLNLPILEVLAHAPIYNALLDKYMKSLELGKNGSTFVQGEVSTKMEDPWLFTLPCRLGDSKPFDTLADLESCVFSTWMTFRGNSHLGSIGEETDEITDLQHDLPRIMFLERGDGVTSTKRRRRDLFGDGVCVNTPKMGLQQNKSIERFLNDFANQPNETSTNDLESDDESVDTLLVSLFPHSDNDSDDDEVLNELIEYENVRMLHRERAINSFDRDDLAFKYNAAKDEDPKCWPACCRIIRRGTGVRVGRGGRGRRPREGNDEHVNELNGQGNDHGLGANEGVEGVNGGVGNQGNVGNQNGNVVNENVQENVQENVRNVLVNGNRVGCSYTEFLACNPKEYDGKGGSVVLTHWIEKIESVQDMSGCSIDQKVKYTTGSFMGKALT
ncbi:hypothetical protein Tco_0619459 [Tanacetum coccineum]